MGLTSDRTHGQRTNAYKKQVAPNRHPVSSILCFLHVQHHIQKARGSRLMCLIIYPMLFTCSAPRTKSKGLPIDIPYHLYYAFYTCSTAYKKQGAPDRCPLSFICPFYTCITTGSLKIYHPTFHTQ
jgi:hypothetical protein